MIKSNIKQLKYFSLSLLTNEKLLTYSNSNIVTTGQIFESSNIFHKTGLFSTDYFGELGSKERNRRGAYIDLKLSILHPLAYIGLTSMNSLYGDIMNGTKKAKWDNTLKDFIYDENGETGYNFFISKLKDIEFKNPNNSDLREFKMRLINIQSDVSLLTTTRQYVIPAGFRDYTIDKSGKPSQDEINDLYRSMINTANMSPNQKDEGYNPFIESIRTKLQKTSIDIYLYLLNLLSGKRGVINGHLLAKVVNYGTRNVITADNSVIDNLKDGNYLRFNQMSVGVYQYAKAIQPIAIAKIKKIMNRIFSPLEKKATIIDKKTLVTSRIDIDTKTIDNYTSSKGINSYLNKFADNEFTKSEFGTSDYAFLMLLEKDDRVSLVYDTALIDDSDYKYLRPITNLELVFIALISEYDKYYASTTRYPAINQGSTFPVKPNIKPTANMRKLTIELDGLEYSIKNYPIISSGIYDSISPHHSKLARLGGDFDGDPRDDYSGEY